MNKDESKTYNNIPLVGGTRYLSPHEEAIKRYEKIIYDLFIVMIVILIYLMLSHQWILSLVFGVLIIFAYLETKKEIKKIKESI